MNQSQDPSEIVEATWTRHVAQAERTMRFTVRRIYRNRVLRIEDADTGAFLGGFALEIEDETGAQLHADQFLEASDGDPGLERYLGLQVERLYRCRLIQALFQPGLSPDERHDLETRATKMGVDVDALRDVLPK